MSEKLVSEINDVEIKRRTSMDGVTVGQARRWLEKQKKLLADDCSCILCDQKVRVYPRPLNGEMARILILVYRYFSEHENAKWLHVDNHLKLFGMNSRYYSLMKFWGLLESKLDYREDGSDRTGYWRITEKGRHFVERKINVPSHFFMYNSDIEKSMGKCGWSEEQVSIDGALFSGGFRFDEMMNLKPVKQVIDVSKVIVG